MVNTVQANADHGRDFHLLTNHMIKSPNVTKGDIRTYFTFKQIFIWIQSAAAMCPNVAYPTLAHFRELAKRVWLQ